MPLMEGKSDKAFSHNVKAETSAGKPSKQALAIAYAIKRKAMKKMARGGVVASPLLEKVMRKHMGMPSKQVESMVEASHDDYDHEDFLTDEDETSENSFDREENDSVPDSRKTSVLERIFRRGA